MNILNQTFASKLPPDNTIKRIEELEKLQKAITGRMDDLEKQPNILFVDLKVRIELMEKDLKAINELHPADKFSAIDDNLKKLMISISGLSATSNVPVPQVDGKVDMTPIL
jgi:carbon monoxide dehydrogenase subunit G